MTKGRVSYPDLIVCDPDVCGAELTVRGTRVILRTLLASLAEGSSQDEILRSFPSLTEGDLDEVIRFAAEVAERQLPPRHPVRK